MLKKAKRQVGARLRAFLGDNGGVVAVIFAMALPLLFGAGGMAVDLAQAYDVKNRLGDALDKAALASGSADTKQHAIDIATSMFNANIPSNKLGTFAAIVVDSSHWPTTIAVSATATVPTTFMSALGQTSISVSATSEVTLPVSVEVSLVLDLSTSMTGQRLTDLKAAANKLIDIIINTAPAPSPAPYKKIAIVPYANSVNVGTAALADAVRGAVTNNTCTYPADPTCSSYKFNRQTDNAQTTQTISTCVSERFGVEAYTDAAPSTALVGKVFPAPGNYNPCLAVNKMEPLTDNKTTLKADITAMTACCSTGGHIGVAWGWYLLSPNFSYLLAAASQPGAYNNDRIIKVVIVMTDGEYNSIYYNGVIAQDSTTGSGTTDYHIKHNSHNGNAYTQAKTLCAAMKAKGVYVYTIGFQVVNAPEASDFIAQCATSAKYVYLPASGAALTDAFTQIAGQIATLHLSK